MSDWPTGYGRHVLPEVDSTMAEAARRAPGAALLPSGAARAPSGAQWILALRQTNGRGRRGRTWHDPDGNFAATLLLPINDTPQDAALRSFVMALALFDACTQVTGTSQGFSLKWPNDVLLHGGKLAGILLESSGVGGRVSYLSIGVGVNLRHAPDRVEPGAVSPVALAAEAGIRIGPEAFLDHLASAFAKREASFQAHGFTPIRDAWLAHAARLGQDIVARTTRDEWRGVFETVDETGNLVLSTAKGRKAIAAAEVFF